MDIHTFSYEHNGSIVVWDVRDIWKAVENVPTVKLPIQLFQSSAQKVFKQYDAEDRERVNEADLTYPIIIPKTSQLTGKIIIDGYHRLYKHIELKHKTVPVKILNKMPRPIYCKGKPFEIDGLEFDWYTPKKK